MDCSKSTSVESAPREQLYMQLNASELSAINMKDSPLSNDRDAGFCSGSSEGGDDLLSIVENSRLAPSSPPTDVSADDSNDVKLSAMALIQRNKRKSCEPSKVVLGSNTSNDANNAVVIATTQTSSSSSSSSISLCHRGTAGPLKKRIRYTSTADSAVVLTPPTTASPPVHHQHPFQHFQPAPAVWNPSQVLPHELMPNPAHVYVRHPGVTTLHRDVPMSMSEFEEQKEPLALVMKRPTETESVEKAAMESISPPKVHRTSTSRTNASPKKSASANTLTPKKQQRIHLDDETPTELASKDFSSNLLASSEKPQTPIFPSTSSSSSTSAATTMNARPQQRNYKNMTRERRIEANARERTRVHTISAAYETLRSSVPSYASSQKLSKLSVLRVACSYILTLSRMAGHDYSEDQSAPSLESCLEAVTSTIQTEGKVKRKKDD